MYGSGTKLGQQMGNTEPGDGFKYRGRGFIQLTGKNNYASASKAIYGDDRLVQNPDLVNQPDVAAQVTAWYMKKGQQSMAKSMGIDTANMSQDQANLLATSQVAGRDVRKGGSYLSGEVMSKVTSYSSQFAGTAGAPVSAEAKAAMDKNLGSATPTTPQTQPATPSATQAQTAVTKTEPPKDQAQQSAIAAEQERIRKEGKPVAGSTPAMGSQETPAALLSQLNTKMDTLIGLTRRVNDTNERQLSVQRNIAQSGDLYVAA